MEKTADAMSKLDALRTISSNSRIALRLALQTYEETGDHRHSRRALKPGEPCPGGDCTVDRVRRALAILDEI